MEKIKDMRIIFTLPKGSEEELNNNVFIFRSYRLNKKCSVIVNNGLVYYSDRDDASIHHGCSLSISDEEADEIIYGYGYINIGHIEECEDTNPAIHENTIVKHAAKRKGIISSLLESTEELIADIDREAEEKIVREQKEASEWLHTYLNKCYSNNTEYFVKYMIQYLLYEWYQFKYITKKDKYISIDVDGCFNVEYEHTVCPEFFKSVSVENKPWYDLDEKDNTLVMTPEEEAEYERRRKEEEEKEEEIRHAFSGDYNDLDPQKKIERVLTYHFEGKIDQGSARDLAANALSHEYNSANFLDAFEIAARSLEKNMKDSATIERCAQLILTLAKDDRGDFSEVSRVVFDIDPLKYLDGKTKFFGQSKDDKVLSGCGELDNYASLLTGYRSSVKENLNEIKALLKSWRKAVAKQEEVKNDERYQKKGFFDFSTANEKKKILDELRRDQEKSIIRIDNHRRAIELVYKELKELEKKYNKAAQKLCSVTETDDFKALEPFKDNTYSVLDYLTSRRIDYRKAADMMGIFLVSDYI